MHNEEQILKYVPKEKQEKALFDLKNGKPIQYIIGNVDFCGNLIKVNENVLIPRFETEELVSRVNNLISKYYENKQIKIADLGTGSGAIAISISKLTNLTVDAYEISDLAIKVANENIINNKVDVNVIKHDIRNILPNKYDVIISNPPYIDRTEEVEQIVLDNEPHLALFADNKGLEFYEKILAYCPEVLNQKGIIAFEIGYLQADEIINIAKRYFPKANIYKENDLAGKPRYIFIINE